MTDCYIQGNLYEGEHLWWALIALGRGRYIEVRYIVKKVRRARNWPLWAGDLYTEVTVKAGLTVTRIYYLTEALLQKLQLI